MFSTECPLALKFSEGQLKFNEKKDAMALHPMHQKLVIMEVCNMCPRIRRRLQSELE